MVNRIKYEWYCEDCRAVYRHILSKDRKCIICYNPLIKVSKGRYIGVKQRERIYKRDHYRCVDCGSSHHLTINHKRPISKGGTNDDYNLQTMCEKCNSLKGNN